MNHLVDAVKRSLDNQNYYSALLVGLALPYIAGRIEYPGEKSRRRYVDWFDRYIRPKYTIFSGGKIRCTLSGDDCYALRCSVLHEARDETSHQLAHDALERFQFVVPDPGMEIHNNTVDTKLQLQLDIFCRDLCDGVADWLKGIVVGSDKDKRLGELLWIQVGGRVTVVP